MTEHDLIRKIRTWLPSRSPSLQTGIGDDAAVVDLPAGSTLLTADSLVEGRHFTWEWSSPEDVGRKLVVVNASDIAAMGGRPLYGLLSLVLPQNVNVSMVETFFKGVREAAQEYSMDVVGGNLAGGTDVWVADLSLVGSVSGAALTRAGLKVGDKIAVTGALGESAGGLSALRALGVAAKQEFPQLVEKHLRPRARCREGQALQAIQGASACIDVSDGLASELGHLSAASKVGIRVRESALPLSNELAVAAKKFGVDPHEWIFHGGEDYELLFGYSPEHEATIFGKLLGLGCPVHEIGEVVPEVQGVAVLRCDGQTENLVARGWDHFSEKEK